MVIQLEMSSPLFTLVFFSQSRLKTHPDYQVDYADHENYRAIPQKYSPKKLNDI